MTDTKATESIKVVSEVGTAFVQSNGIRMAYQEFGDADAPVILLVAEH